MSNSVFPEKFISLHSGEEFLRSESINAIIKDENLLIHSHAIERSMDVIDYFARQYPHENEDQLTIQLLGIRFFNGSAVALKLLLSGYYQASALQQRDLLETIFLLDYFTTDKTLISTWRTSDKKTRKNKFKPVTIRTALDDRDSFTERKRAAAYDLLCELAGHPTATGFSMLAPVPGGNAHCGPFFEFTAMKATLEELVKLLIQVTTIFIRFFEGKKREDHEMKLSCLENMGEWSEKFYSRSFHGKQIEELRALLAQDQV